MVNFLHCIAPLCAMPQHLSPSPRLISASPFHHVVPAAGTSHIPFPSNFDCGAIRLGDPHTPSVYDSSARPIRHLPNPRPETRRRTQRPVWTCTSRHSKGSRRRGAILPAYLLSEIVPRVAISTAAISTLALSLGVGPDIARLLTSAKPCGRTIWTALTLLTWRIPFYVQMALPIACLLAPIWGFGRLAAHNELTALSGGGVSRIRILRCTAILFLLLALFHGILSQQLAPSANRRADLTLRPTLEYTPLTLPHFKGSALKRLVYAGGWEGNCMQQVTMVEGGVRPDRIVRARSAVWDNNEGVWVMEGGWEHTVGRGQGDGSWTLRSAHQFESKACEGMAPSPVDLSLMGGEWDMDAMDAAQMVRLQRLHTEAGNERNARTVQLRFHQRIGLSFACLIFGGLGSLIGLRRKARQPWVVPLLILGTIFGYYALSVVGAMLAQVGEVRPVIGAWLPNLLGLLCSFILAKASVGYG